MTHIHVWQMVPVRAHVNYALVLAFALWDMGMACLMLSGKAVKP